MRYKAKITTNWEPKLIYETFLPEKNAFKKERSSYTINANKDSVEFEIEAEDATALRATLTSITKLLSVIENANP